MSAMTNTSWWFITHFRGILSTRKEMAEQLQCAGRESGREEEGSIDT